MATLEAEGADTIIEPREGQEGQTTAQLYDEQSPERELREFCTRIESSPPQ